MWLISSYVYPHTYVTCNHSILINVTSIPTHLVLFIGMFLLNNAVPAPNLFNNVPRELNGSQAHKLLMAR